jgi:hypothetical protein
MAGKGILPGIRRVGDMAGLKAAAVAVILLVAVPVYFLFDPSSFSFFPGCPFYQLTGFYCPGCGSQRAFHALLHGRLADAAGFNLLAVAALPLIFYSAAVFSANHLFRRRWPQLLFYKTWFSRLVLVLVLSFWLLRNLPFPCFRWMAP